jgi:hypothetical protein
MGDTLKNLRNYLRLTTALVSHKCIVVFVSTGTRAAYFHF